MKTECSNEIVDANVQVSGLKRRRIDVDFGAGRVSSDGGGLLLRELDLSTGLMERLSECFTDHRCAERTEHTVVELLRQRVFGLALGYEDLNDHEELSRDPLMATLVGKTDPAGMKRKRVRDLGQGSASASTLGRLERTMKEATSKDRYAKIVCDYGQLRTAFVEQLIRRYDGKAPSQLVLDLDPSDIQLHGQQEERFFHGYYDHHCYLPMYLFCGEYPLAVELRPSNIDGAKGSVEMLKPVVAQLRVAFPKTQLIVRGDSGFCRDALLTWCESEKVDYIVGLARNNRLAKELKEPMAKAKAKHEKTGRAAREFRSFRYETLNSWSRKRRVVGKAEYLSKGPNPRFVVTSLPSSQFGKRALYEDLYCARGEMENRIKEQQLGLFGTRTSCHRFRPNHIRVWLSLAAQLLIVLLRERALVGTELAKAQAGTLRVRLLKIGAIISVSVRRVCIRLSSAFPRQALFRLAMQQIRGGPTIQWQS